MDEPTALQDEAQSWQYAPTNSPVDTAIKEAADPNVSPQQSAASEEAAITYDPVQAKADAQAQAQQQKAEQAAYRLTAQDLGRRGIGYYTDLSTGAPTTVTDESGAPLTNFDKASQIGYDSQGNPRKLSFNAQTGNAELQDPYESAQQVTDKAGNIYTAPKGLPWRFEGVNPDVQHQVQEAAQEKLETQTATALAAPVAMEKARFVQAQQAVDASEKSTSTTLQKLGVPMTGTDGSPVDLTNTSPDQLRAMVKGSYDSEMASPEANEKQFFGDGLSQSAQALRQDIANRQKQAQDALEQHLGVVSAMQQAGSSYDQARAPLAAVSVAKLNRLNDNRVAAGLPPVQIPQELQRVAQLAAPPIPGMDHAGQISPQQQQPAAPPTNAPQSEGAVQTFLRRLETGIFPALGTAGGGIAGAAGAGLIGLPSGPGAIAAAIAGDVAGGTLGGSLAQKAQDAIMGGEWTAQNQAQMAANAKAHPLATMLGDALPMLISMFGGGGGKTVKAAGEGIEKAAQGLLSRTVDATGANPGLLTKAMGLVSDVAAKGAGELPSLMTIGARTSGAGTAEQDVTAHQDFSNVLPEAIKGAVTFGPTAFLPAASTLVGRAAKGLGMAGVMELSNALYDHFVDGKPLNPKEMAQRFGTSGPAFALQEIISGLLHGGPVKPAGEIQTSANQPQLADKSQLALQEPKSIIIPPTPPEMPQKPLALEEPKSILAPGPPAPPAKDATRFEPEGQERSQGPGGSIVYTPSGTKESTEGQSETAQKSAATEPAKIVGPAMFHEGEQGREPVEIGHIGDTHADLMARATANDVDATEATHGFHTENGEILNREEAAQRALDAGQIDQPTFDKAMSRTGDNKGLHSQDLFQQQAAEAPARREEAVAPKATYEEGAQETHPEPTPEQKSEVEKHLSTPEAKEVLSRLQKLRGVKMTDEATGRSLETDSSGTTLNRRALANHLTRLDSEEAKQHYVVRGLDEELKHQATLLALKPAELEAVGKGLTPEERSAVEAHYGAKMSHYAAGAEAIRTFMQAAEGRGTTEAHKLLTERAKTDSPFRAAVQKVLDLIHKIAGNKGAMSERLRDGIERTQAVLDSIEKGTDVGKKVRLGNSPQLHTVTEQLPRQKGDLPDEAYFRVKNDRTGETQVVESRDMTPVKVRSAEERTASAQRAKSTEEQLNKRLRAAGLDPSAFPNSKSKREALRRERELGAQAPEESKGMLTPSRIMASLIDATHNPERDAGRASTREEASAHIARSIAGGTFADEFEREDAERKALVDWAKSSGHLIERLPSKFDTAGKDNVGGGEHDVWFDEPSQRWVKLAKTSFGFYPEAMPDGGAALTTASPLKYLSKLEAMEKLFGIETQVHGVMLSHGGRPRFLVSQPDVRGKTLTEERLAQELKSAGFKEVDKASGGWYRPSDNTMIFDAHNGNLALVHGKLAGYDVIAGNPEGDLRRNLEEREQAASSRKPTALRSGNFLEAARAQIALIPRLEETPQEALGASAPTQEEYRDIRNRPVEMSPRDIRGGYQLLNVPTDKLEKAWEKDGGFYLSPTGENWIPGRMQGLREWLKSNPDAAIGAPRASVLPNGTIAFENGRHRTRLMMDSGRSQIPLAFDPESVERAKTMLDARPQGIPGLTEPAKEEASEHQVEKEPSELQPVRSDAEKTELRSVHAGGTNWLHAAKPEEVEKMPEEQRAASKSGQPSPSGPETGDYRGEHRAPDKESGAPLHDLTGNGVYPSDVYSSKGIRYYGTGYDAMDRDAHVLVSALKGRPNAQVKIYRVVPYEPTNAEKIAKYEGQKRFIQKHGELPPDADSYFPKIYSKDSSSYYEHANNEIERLKNAPEPTQAKYSINAGDWVTPIRKYAIDHGQSALNGKYKILSKTVPAKHVFTAGDSWLEWGYDPTANPENRAPDNGARMERERELAKSESGEEPLGASIPQTVHDAYDSMSKKVAGTFRDAKAEAKSGPINEQIKKGYDANGTIAHLSGEQAGNSIRLDFNRPAAPNETRAQKSQREAQTKLDLQAARYVQEAGGDMSKLQDERQKILASPNQKVKDAHLKIIDHAIYNLSDLNSKLAGHRKLADQTYNELKATGEDFGKREDYVRRVTIPPEDPNAPNPLFSIGSGQGNSPKGMEKARAFDTLGDAVKAGYDPGTYGIHEADQNMVTNAQKIIGGKAFVQEMHNIKSPTDGKPVLSEMQKVKYPNGKEDTRVPKGYSVVTAPGGRPMVVHNSFAPLFRALYGQSAIRNSIVGRGLLKAAALTKQLTLIGDTFHVGRVLYKGVTSRMGTPNIGKGLSLIEYHPDDLDRAVRLGEVAPHEAQWAKDNRAIFQEGLQHGLNIGRIADNLVQQASAHLPGFGKINDWIFSSLTRDQMAQTYVDFAKRNADQVGEGKRFATRDDAIRQAAKETNELYGSLGNQGLFQNKTMQDMARLIFLAPQWAESQFRNEARSYGQGLKAAYQYARTGGQDRFTGNSVRTFAAGMVALLAANQVVNFVSRGQSTFQNKEDDHKLDAWIPGGKLGFWFSPLEIAGEYAHAAFKYAAQHQNPVDIATHIINNKLSPEGRGVQEALTGRDYAGRHFLSDTDRFRAAATDILPSPIPLNMFFEKDPRQPTGWRMTRQPGAMEKQILQSAGAKVTAAQSPRSQMFAIAQPFRADRGQTDTAGEYTELRRALDNDDTAGAKSEIEWLRDRGHSMDSIASAVGISKNGAIKPETFAGSQSREREMLAKLTPAQMDIYQQAQRNHAANAMKFLRIANTVRAIPQERKPFQFQ